LSQNEKKLPRREVNENLPTLGCGVVCFLGFSRTVESASDTSFAGRRKTKMGKFKFNCFGSKYTKLAVVDEGDAGHAQQEHRDVVAFWLLGLFNNMGYCCCLLPAPHPTPLPLLLPPFLPPSPVVFSTRHDIPEIKYIIHVRKVGGSQFPGHEHICRQRGR
jgi:hypothetical protein